MAYVRNTDTYVFQLSGSITWTLYIPIETDLNLDFQGKEDMDLPITDNL